jgi:predicted O-linked N-acetylglucosamine transferase (SPINDLY family)
MKRAGHPRLASVARLNKISNGTLDAWSDALREVPEARMLVIAQGLQNSMIQARLQERFRQRGIAPERIDLRGGVGIDEYFALHSQIDLFLDTTPWSGHTTTLHGLWMGVPTVTFERAHHAGRFTTMVMRNAGLPEFIAADAAGFGAQVRRVLDDDALMEQVRTQGREILRGSALMDHAGLAGRFQGACDEMWKSCSGGTPAPVQTRPAAGNC